MTDSGPGLSELGMSHENALEDDVPQMYIAREAYAYTFDREMRKHTSPIETNRFTVDRSIKRSWYKGQENNQLLWLEANGENEEGDFKVLGQEAEATFNISLHVTSNQQKFQLRDFLDFVARVSPSQNKLSAIQKLSQVTIDDNFEGELVRVLTDTVKDHYSDIDFSKITSLRQLKMLINQRQIKPTSWKANEVEPRHFNLLPHIKSPIPVSTDEKLYDTIKARLANKSALPTPDRDYLEHKTIFLGETAEFVDTADIVGGVDTTQYWGDVLDVRRPASTFTDLMHSFQNGEFFTPKDQEITLWRVKKTLNDKGELYVMEGNHRVSLLTALDVSKFPALVKTVCMN